MFSASGKLLFFIIACILGSVFLLDGCQSKQTDPLQKIHSRVEQQIAAYDSWIKDEWTPMLQTDSSATSLQKSFLKGRLLYKKAEWAIEYFFPSTAKNINGAPLPEIEPEEHTVVEAMGMQVIEEIIFPAYAPSDKASLLSETRKLKSVTGRLAQLWQGHTFRNDQVFDALRQQLFRVISLGISGFDMPVALKGHTEIPTVLNEINKTALLYQTAALQPDFDSLARYLNRGIELSINVGFDDFDRLAFITSSINPATTKLLHISKKSGWTVMDGINAIDNNAPTLFEQNSFNVNYFIPDVASTTAAEKVVLGKMLFYDPVLSGMRTVSCATCHKPEKAFTDGLTTSVATAGTGFLKRNTPTLLNAGLQQAQFYDMRAPSLEDQVKNVVENKDEFHGSMEEAAVRLNKNANWKKQFAQTFGEVQTIEPIHIQIALAGYVRSLRSFNSPFDLYMRGDKNSMTTQQQKGFNLFMGKAKCGTCHFMPLFNGTVPPSYNSSESEVIGVPADKNGQRMDTDKGRFLVHQIPEFEFSFKTPTVRNVALTAPYMHNGVFETLEEVLEFYNKGGGAGLGLPYKYQTLPADSLGLTINEKNQIIAFMRALTDTSGDY